MRGLYPIGAGMEPVPAVRWRLPLGGRQKGSSLGSLCGGPISISDMAPSGCSSLGCRHGGVQQQTPAACCWRFRVQEPLDFQVPALFRVPAGVVVGVHAGASKAGGLAATVQTHPAPTVGGGSGPDSVVHSNSSLLEPGFISSWRSVSHPR